MNEIRTFPKIIRSSPSHFKKKNENDVFSEAADFVFHFNQ